MQNTATGILQTEYHNAEVKNRLQYHFYSIYIYVVYFLILLSPPLVRRIYRTS